MQKSVVCQDWAGVARDEGAAAAAWLAAFMQKPARLVGQPPFRACSACAREASQCNIWLGLKAAWLCVTDVSLAGGITLLQVCLNKRPSGSSMCE